jgi:hypothetical protein
MRSQKESHDFSRGRMSTSHLGEKRADSRNYVNNNFKVNIRNYANTNKDSTGRRKPPSPFSPYHITPERSRLIPATIMDVFPGHNTRKYVIKNKDSPGKGNPFYISIFVIRFLSPPFRNPFFPIGRDDIFSFLSEETKSFLLSISSIFLCLSVILFFLYFSLYSFSVSLFPKSFFLISLFLRVTFIPNLSF